MTLPSSVSSVSEYVRVVHSFPKLDPDEERALAERWREYRDVQAAWRLVTSHLRYVVWMANGYRGYGLPLEDLIQEGNVGLMKAVKRFDPGRGPRLLTYAVYWIRAQIHEFILKNWRIVKSATTKARRKLFYKLRQAKHRLEWLTPEESSRIADSLGVSEDDVVDMEASLYGTDESFDGGVRAADDARPAPAAWLADDSSRPDAPLLELDLLQKASNVLPDALAALDPRSREVIERRWLADDEHRMTLIELGKRFGVSAERIRQIESQAIARLRRHLLPKLGFEPNNASLAAL
ncbi:MAG TPA: RNA polymerase sigma factor RpoH [Woeseiaceae bacterium]|nr:RNA polymerase sigma factor RpoH [Woeseiaceae bacterium]